jgi:hypothetical protein
MQADTRTIVELFSMAGLIGGTIEYSQIVRRRGAARRDAAFRVESADAGVRGLARVMLMDRAEDGSADKG